MNNNEQNKKSVMHDILPMLIGEVIVATLVCLGFAIADILGLYHTDFGKVILGAALGAGVIVVNHLSLVLSVDKQIKIFIEQRGDQEMSEEEIELFTKKHSASIQGAMKVSFIIRTLSIFAVLIVAFVTKWFNPIATAIPMFAFRTIITVTDGIMKKYDKKPDPSKFIRYDDEDEKEKEEEN